MEIDQPVIAGAMFRTDLSAVDERFGSLDPLIVLEEFAEATPATDGGRLEGGEGRTGPVRALARLAVRCGALEFEQRENEDFDAAVERAQSNLLVARSRIKRRVQTFPGGIPNESIADA